MVDNGRTEAAGNSLASPTLQDDLAWQWLDKNTGKFKFFWSFFLFSLDTHSLWSISQFVVSSCAHWYKWPLVFFISIGTSFVFKLKASLPNVAIRGFYKWACMYSNDVKNDSRILTWHARGIFSIALNAVPLLLLIILRIHITIHIVVGR